MTRAGTVLVTGATGFLGTALCPLLTAHGLPVRPAGRDETGDIGPETDWRPLLDGAETVIHLAARAHVMRDRAADPLAAFQRVNTAATAALARAATDAGIKRFIFVSTVKVLGETARNALTAGDPAAPQDPYAVSKWQAEQALAKHAGAFDLVILRPPLVYGPGVRGNFLTLLRAIDRGWPLPLGGIDNRRSLIHLGNLADAIRAALTVAPGVYLPSDREDLSTPELIRRLAAALGRPARLIAVPPALLRTGAKIAGRTAALDRLAGSLTVDGALPGWTPPHTPAEGFAETARWYRDRNGGNL
ncbi:MAG: NAD-dependent epimerase/dehydratase family protein [Alphaproteobacteria bacterium]|nr:NAD-dependent epimerase/dehydratase family protein [Alphaproteobacteria bacterium]